MRLVRRIADQDNVTATTESSRAASLEQRLHAAFNAFRRLTLAWDAPAAPEVKEAARMYQDAVDAQRGWYERRIAALERQLLEVLACDGVGGDQREHAIGLLNEGRKQRIRDAKLLSSSEQRVVDTYRALDLEARQMLRTLFERLAATPPKGGEQ